VLSGFLLWQPWVRAATGSCEPPRPGAFLLRRAARIIPAYYVALVGSVLLLWGLAGTPGVRLPDGELLALFGVFAQNFSPGTVMKLDPPMWTIAIEASFYVVLPLLGWLALRRRRVVIAVPVLFAAIGASAVALPMSLAPAAASWRLLERPAIRRAREPFIGRSRALATVTEQAH
jgi:peptidoglycan/LPS O-acetylase OafA/YrhL